MIRLAETRDIIETAKSIRTREKGEDKATVFSKYIHNISVLLNIMSSMVNFDETF